MKLPNVKPSFKSSLFLGFIFNLLVIPLLQGQEPGEIHTQANAASIGTNEGNTTDGWTSLATLTSIDANETSIFEGTYAMKLVSKDSTDGNYAFYNFNAINGLKYRIQIRAKKGDMVSNPASAQFWRWQGVDGFESLFIDSEDWTLYEFYVTATRTNPQIRVYTGGTSTYGLSGNTVYIDAVSITPAETEAPDAVTDLTATEISSSSLNLTWSTPYDNVGVTNYEIFRNGVSIANTDSNSYTVTGLIPGSSYVFTIKASDAAGNQSALSNPASLTPSEEIYADGNAASLNNEADATTGWSGDVDINSVNTEKADGDYSIEIKSRALNTELGRFASYTFSAQVGVRYAISLSAKQGSIISSSPAPYLNMRDVTLSEWVNIAIGEEWTQYQFYVVAESTTPQLRVYTGNFRSEDTAGNTVYIDGVSINRAETTPPDAITDLSATTISANSVALSWSAPYDNEGVVLYRIYEDGVEIDTTTSTTYTVNGLESAQSYAFTVKAEDAAGNLA